MAEWKAEIGPVLPEWRLGLWVLASALTPHPASWAFGHFTTGA